MCVIKVHISEMFKMKAIVVSYSLSMPKIYSVLPPPKDELDEILTFLYFGSNVPTEKTTDTHLY